MVEIVAFISLTIVINIQAVLDSSLVVVVVVVVLSTHFPLIRIAQLAFSAFIRHHLIHYTANIFGVQIIPL